MQRFTFILLGSLLFSPPTTVALSQDAGKPIDTRLPVPTDTDAAEKVVRDLFKAEYAKKKPADHIELAKKLLKIGDETTNDPATKFVVYRDARNWAARGGDVPLALAVARSLSQAFAVSPIEARLVAIETTEKWRSSPGRVVIEIALEGTDESVRADEYPSAERFLKVAALAAGRGAELFWEAVVTARTKEVERIEKEFESIASDRL
ncbi:hypothetical protein [Fimbriiglobus ruber]|uniref:HEAT repeat domain-containing protein n=1 Tax=Fimbriiglobus ruber TaxID=1908690 RepID=A0A225DTL8_9BACT|nr:hypothetical protein [Fimbriiglobus ruber]OWK40529.1 hypothetical protein FRUB_05448 [Fimbriiglobus ruber]